MREEQHKEFLESMERVRAANATTPDKARKFLQEEGVLTASGELTDRYSTTPSSTEEHKAVFRVPLGQLESA